MTIMYLAGRIDAIEEEEENPDMLKGSLNLGQFETASDIEEDEKPEPLDE